MTTYIKRKMSKYKAKSITKKLLASLLQSTKSKALLLDYNTI